MAEFDFAPYGVVINAAAYTAVDAAETAEGRRDGLGGQRRRASRALVGRRPGAPQHPGARLLRLRLRRHRELASPRTSRSARWGSTARPRRPATRWSPTLPRHYIAAHQLGDRRRAQLRPHHGRRWPTAGVAPERRRRPVRSADVHRRPGPGDRPPGRRSARRTAPTTSATAGRPMTLGRHRPHRVTRPAAPTPAAVTAVTHSRVRRGQGRWPPGRSTACWIWTRSSLRGFRAVERGRTAAATIWRRWAEHRPTRDRDEHRRDDQAALRPPTTPKKPAAGPAYRSIMCPTAAAPVAEPERHAR